MGTHENMPRGTVLTPMDLWEIEKLLGESKI